ncbi:C2 calcium/lipid-binding and GRAM domain containing protein [Rhynchospora pubera]|uniref:C2 calcium/lipid-binding and GRAM domain containing protein n=1 Tax=Rhynchospora pubera TaxID=906938 RepID=A0AAV8CVW3_9POAL|nr:C2 calcium/lipid-binding and GRAM domain containing protein [Rhynchospora pubera]
MRLLVHIIEARNLLAKDSNGFSDPFVVLQLGNQKYKTKVINMNLNPTWDEKFSFEVRDVRDALRIHVYDKDRIGKDFLGKVKFPLSDLLNTEGLSFGTQWYKLQPENEKSKIKECGDIHLMISMERGELRHSFSEPIPEADTPKRLDGELLSFSHAVSDIESLLSKQDSDSSSVPETIYETEVREQSQSTSGTDNGDEKLNDEPTLAGRLRNIFTGRVPELASLPETPLAEVLRTPVPGTPIPGLAKTPFKEPTIVDVHQNGSDTIPSANAAPSFDELLKSFESCNKEAEMPSNLPGGVLLDQHYVASPSELNFILFSPDSDFLQLLSEIQKSTNFQAETWKIGNGGQFLKRGVSYVLPPSTMVKAVKAIDEQNYLKANGDSFCVLSSVSTPDLPAVGGCFKTEVLFCITSGPDLPTKEKTSRLVISWRINFIQSTMLKGRIESGARQGLKENYAKFADLLSQKAKTADLREPGTEKDQLLADLQAERESVGKLIMMYFGNFTVVSYVVVLLSVLLHLLLLKKSERQGLEFGGLDVPDSICEIAIGGLLVLQGQLVLNKVRRFVQARRQQGGDHGVKAQGDGWLLTVALIEGSKLAAVDSTGSSDPYVVFSCNGMTKTSSIKFQSLGPQWNEIFEFDAMLDPPSVMRIDVYDFDGPFDEITSLGYAEINFVKSNLSELSDVWVPLQGNLAKSCESKLHLRIFLNNSKGTEVVTDYLKAMEKEVGHKITMRSPEAHAEFQKIFHLPPEEFLINDFSCQLKRKMPLQGRLFLSPRIIAFYSSLFGHKIKFYFLWEDIEDIQLITSNNGYQSIFIILHKGKGLDAKHGAKSTENGKLKFHFQYFVSFTVAKRTIVALWKARSLTPEQKVQIAAEESGDRHLSSEDSGQFLGFGDAKKTEIFCSVLHFDINSLMEAFDGGPVELRVMEAVGCTQYTATEWETVRSDTYQRQTHYKCGKNLSACGGEASSTQQKVPLGDGKKGWIIDEVMELQGVLLGDFYNIHTRYQIEDLSPKQKACNVQVSLGVAWQKSTKHQKRVTKNVISNSTKLIQKIFSQIEKELAAPK